MSENELIGLLSLIRVAYPRFYLNITMSDVKSTVALWYEIFKKDAPQDVDRAVKELITELEYPPTIADVKKRIKKYEDTRKFFDSARELEEKEKKEQLLLTQRREKAEEPKPVVNVKEHLSKIRTILFGGGSE